METKKKFSCKKKINETQKYDYEAFVKHLNRVTLDKVVKSYIIFYYESLAEQDIVLKRSDFDSITLKEEGKADQKIEQEAVQVLFKDKDEIRAEEAFAYNFIHHLKKIKKFAFKNIVDVVDCVEQLKDDILNNERFDGTFVEKLRRDYEKDSLTDKFCIFLEKYLPRLLPQQNLWTAWYDPLDKRISIPSNLRVKYIENGRYFQDYLSMLDITLLHEIAHVHALKSFPKLFNLIGVVVSPYYRYDGKDQDYVTNLLDDNSIEASQKRSFVESSVLVDIDEGSLALDETLNEVYCGLVRRNCYFIKNEQIFSEKYYMKNLCVNVYETKERQFSAVSPYYLHSDIPAMLHTVFPDISVLDMRNKTLKLKKALNSLNISPNIREGLEGILREQGCETRGVDASNVRIYTTFQGERDTLTAEELEELKRRGIDENFKLSNAELFYLAIGVSDSYFQQDLEEPDNNDTFEIKASLQACLINGHKNNLLKQMSQKSFYSKKNLEEVYKNLLMMDLCTIKSKSDMKTVSELEFENLLQETGLKKHYSKYCFNLKHDLTHRPLEL